MKKKDVETVGLLVDKANEIIPCLNDENYDFGNLVNNFIFEINVLEEEKKKQDKILEVVKEITKDKFKDNFKKDGKEEYFNLYFDDYFSSIFRIDNYLNYYVVWFYGAPYMGINFVFDKDGNLLFDNGAVYGLDNENFFVIKYEAKEMIDRLYHYQLKNDNFELVNSLDNVNDIDYNNFFKNDRLVICSCNSEKMLYNYKKAKIIIPSFSDIYQDLGRLNQFRYGYDDSIRLVKKIFTVENYKYVLVSKLEFLVNKYGMVDNNVPLWDFENKRYYYLNNNGNQAENLNCIYDRVREEYVSINECINKLVRKNF